MPRHSQGIELCSQHPMRLPYLPISYILGKSKTILRTVDLHLLHRNLPIPFLTETPVVAFSVLVREQFHQRHINQSRHHGIQPDLFLGLMTAVILVNCIIAALVAA